MKPQINARYTIDLPYLFGSDSPVGIRGVVSLGWVSWLTAIVDVEKCLEMKTDKKFETEK
jgi:hypothetical protein